MDAEVPQDVRRNAYGQAVWSCPANAGDKLRDDPRSDGGNKAGSPGSSRKTIAQGMSCDFGVPVLTCVRLFRLHARQWVRRAPGIPCALCFPRATELQDPDAKSRRGNAKVWLFEIRIGTSRES